MFQAPLVAFYIETLNWACPKSTGSKAKTQVQHRVKHLQRSLVGGVYRQNSTRQNSTRLNSTDNTARRQNSTRRNSTRLNGTATKQHSDKTARAKRAQRQNSETTKQHTTKEHSDKTAQRQNSTPQAQSTVFSQTLASRVIIYLRTICRLDNKTSFSFLRIAV